VPSDLVVHRVGEEDVEVAVTIQVRCDDAYGILGVGDYLLFGETPITFVFVPSDLVVERIGVQNVGVAVATEVRRIDI